MARIDRIDPLFDATAPMPTEVALTYLGRPHDDTSTLVLSAGGTAIVLVRSAGWSYLEAETQAKRRNFDTFAYLNRDGTRGAGQLTGHGTYRPVARRHLVAVA